MHKILIANRGEIALRVMRTCKRMGIRTVAVYSEADRNALHVRFADEAYLLGPGPSNQSYLLGDKIIDICKQSGAEGIHPGYGFLSENAAFARKVKEAGLTLIGPGPESMELMGSKLASKNAVVAFGVPLVPGTKDAVTDPAEARKIAGEIGYPVLIKASAGGGGKGMRVVHSENELEEQMNRASSEALSSFGDAAVFIEKYVGSPRHIEIQVMGDMHGNVLYLFERECSIQRRHQKLVEEAPSAVVNESLRKRMGEAAVNVAKAAGYYGAGTVEFLVDEQLNFYFLEMNTRLQVEHPVTELISGLDLVELQIRVARGEHLNLKQEDLRIHGHAIELRVCAEDPFNDFLPNIGQLTRYEKPQADWIRVDDCVESGYEIPIYYDNMIAKLIVWGQDRAEAIYRMKKAIKDYKIEGIVSTLPFGYFVMNHPNFVSGEFDTRFIQLHYQPEAILKEQEERASVAAFLGLALKENDQSITLPQSERGSAWMRNRS